jgi:hypothetical protein
MKTLFSIACLLMLFIVPKPAAAADAQSAFNITTKKSEDRVVVSAAEDRTIFTVTSPSGIGSATIAPKDGTWPKSVTLRLRLSGLESLSIASDKTTWAAEVSSHGDGKAMLRLIEDGKEKPVEKDKPYWTEIKIIDSQGKAAKQMPLKDGYFELIVPAELLQGRPKSLAISWIDFYR